MAAGFKQATVNAASVPSTQTDFPSYVDLSRLGITTLAEAQSVRVYADSAKTTEWAREIVSATEMHVKVPSLTSTVTIYVDWDGVSADYATTDTYGRNAVWTDYEFVAHDGSTDSTGTYTPTANGGITAGGATGKMGTATTFDGSNDHFTLGNPAGLKLTTVTNQVWAKTSTSQSSYRGLFVRHQQIGAILTLSNEILTYDWSGGGNRLTGQTINTGAWRLIHSQATSGSANTAKVYVDGVLRLTSTVTNTGDDGWYLGQISSSTGQNFAGDMDEFRIRASLLTADWITTEYNNQNAESTFWGTWTTVGGGGGPTPASLLMMMGVG